MFQLIATIVLITSTVGMMTLIGINFERIRNLSLVQTKEDKRIRKKIKKAKEKTQGLADFSKKRFKLLKDLFLSKNNKSKKTKKKSKKDLSADYWKKVKEDK